MKLLVCGDIHGSALSARKLVSLEEKEQFDKIIVLGDVLYHGPRNPLPEDYAPMQVVELLNPLAEKIIAVRGNCDAEIDRQLLAFDANQDAQQFLLGNRLVYLTHGHVYSFDQHPQLPEGTVFLYGHFHVPCAEKRDGIYYGNPGSASLPKGGFAPSYGILSEEGFAVYDFHQQKLMKVDF